MPAFCQDAGDAAVNIHPNNIKSARFVFHALARPGSPAPPVPCQAALRRVAHDDQQAGPFRVGKPFQRPA